MKKLVLLLSVIALLIIATGAVSAGKPAPDYVTVTGNTTYFDFGPLPKERTWFYVTAQGDANGYIDGEPFSGRFTFEEWGEGDLDVATFKGSGNNSGIVTIFDANNRLLVRFEFDGKFDTDREASESVWGKWKAKHPNPNFRGNGDYTGNSGLVFSVTFSGKLKG